jgi:hypothetical protein
LFGGGEGGIDERPPAIEVAGKISSHLCPYTSDSPTRLSSLRGDDAAGMEMLANVAVIELTSANGFRPKAQVRFTSLALGVIIRFPVDLQQAAEIDERVTRELLRELEHQPKLKLATSDGPDIALRTDFVSGAVPG